MFYAISKLLFKVTSLTFVQSVSNHILTGLYISMPDVKIWGGSGKTMYANFLLKVMIWPVAEIQPPGSSVKKLLDLCLLVGWLHTLGYPVAKV
jgi:hypothetical protein